MSISHSTSAIILAAISLTTVGSNALSLENLWPEFWAYGWGLAGSMISVSYGKHMSQGRRILAILSGSLVAYSSHEFAIDWLSAIPLNVPFAAFWTGFIGVNLMGAVYVLSEKTHADPLWLLNVIRNWKSK